MFIVLHMGGFIPTWRDGQVVWNEQALSRLDSLYHIFLYIKPSINGLLMIKEMKQGENVLHLCLTKKDM